MEGVTRLRECFVQVGGPAGLPACLAGRLTSVVDFLCGMDRPIPWRPVTFGLGVARVLARADFPRGRERQFIPTFLFQAYAWGYPRVRRMEPMMTPRFTLPFCQRSCSLWNVYWIARGLWVVNGKVA